MKKYLIIMLAVLASASCAKEQFQPIETGSGIQFRFEAATEGTKAYLTDDFKICWEQAKDAVSVFAKTDNCRFEAVTTGTSTWLEGTLSQVTSTYYALYPYNADATNSTGSITTTLPAEQKAVLNQFSNIVAVAATKEKSLLFQPCVCLVEVDLATQGVHTISFRGNNGELIAGTIRMSAGTKDDNDPNPVVVEGIKEVSISDGGSELQPGKYYIAVAPQMFTKGVTISIKGSAGSAEKVTSKPVAAGRSKRLLAGTIDLPLVPEDSSFSMTYADGDIQGTVYPGAPRQIVYSYSGTRNLQYHINSDAPVSIEYFMDGSQSSASEATGRLAGPVSLGGSVIDLLPVAGSGGENDNVRRLRAASPRGSYGDPVNLTTDNNSLFGGGRSGSNTANCYVVRTPGWYSFPLVYGNAIKGGNANPGAYSPSVSGTTVLSPFIDSSGNAITSPYISNAVSARLEWEDAVGLIEELELRGSDANSLGIAFRVPQETIREGNALISAIDASGQVVWSWHIWVSGAPDSDFAPVSVTNKASQSFSLARINVGWVAPYDSPIVFEGRTTGIRITQQGSGKTLEFTLVQTGATLPANATGTCPFYQWGRKDPFVAGNGEVVEDASLDCPKKTWYTTERRDTVGTRAARLGKDIAAYISHPTHYNMDSGGDGKYSNLWNATQAKFSSSSTAAENAAAVVKTVYDPCPVGACLPPIGAMTGFSNANTAGGFDLGFAFYSNPDKTGETVFYPAVGSMATSNLTSTKVFGTMRNSGTGFSYWAANANNATSGFNMNCYNKGTVNTGYGSNRQYVYPIRPAIYN